jgi:hypothetical protein
MKKSDIFWQSQRAVHETLYLLRCMDKPFNGAIKVFKGEMVGL